jgi:hypothetical protein
MTAKARSHCSRTDAPRAMTPRLVSGADLPRKPDPVATWIKLDLLLGA